MVLMVAMVIVKIIGFVYKLPLSNLLGEVGFGYFSGAYDIYTYFYAISMAGLPVAVARLISEYVEANHLRNALQVYKVAKKIFFITGIFSTVLLAAIAVPYSNFTKAPMNYVSVLAIAPCVFFCCMMSAYRGFYQSLQNMIPTAVSQVFEAAGKLVFGLAFSYVIIEYGMDKYRAAPDGVATIFGVEVTNETQALSAIYPYSAAGAVFGVTVGSVLGLVYLMILHKRKAGTIFTREEILNSPAPESDKDLAKTLIKIAIPIAVGSIIFNISNFIDNVSIRRRLVYALAQNADVIKNMYADSFALTKTVDEDIPTFLFGIYNAILSYKGLIPSLLMTFGTSSVPALAASWSSGNIEKTKSTITSIMRLTMLVALPAGFGMAALARPILEFVYIDLGSKPAYAYIGAPILALFGLGMALFSSVTPLTNMLQAVGRTDIPIKSVVVGSVVKVILNYFLIGNPNININGAAIGSVVSYIIMFSFCFFALLKETKIKTDVMSVFIKPFVSAALCGVTAWALYGIVIKFVIDNNPIALVASVGCGVVVYAVSLCSLKGIAKDDVLMLPKGEKIAQVLEKFKVLG